MIDITEVDNGIRFKVRVQPRSSKNQIAVDTEGALKVKLTAPPVEGEANQALIAYLAAVFRVAKRDIILAKGELSRHKIIEIKGITAEEFVKIISG
ncbi:MAG: DUF167 domain-containing protein [Syntrophomonadaceae bacterium]|jgi:uncharacterized protein (TIGR00251 family)